MAATDIPTTFTELFTALLNAVKSDTGTTSTNRAKRYINRANHDLHIQNDFWWAERKAVVLTHDEYTTGNISIAAATRTTLEGNGTAWSTAVTGMGYNNVRAGGKITFSGATDVYEISSVTDADTATLVSRYIGNIGVASTYALAYGNYTYYEDEYALESDYWRPADVRSFDLNETIEIVGREEFYRAYARNSTTGTPRICTLIELGPGSSTALRPRVVFHPPPDAVYTIPYRFYTTNLAVSTAGTGAANLSADTDEPIIPVRYRNVLLYYALREWYRDEKDDQRAAEVEGQYVDLLKRITNDTTPDKDRPILVASRARSLAGVAGFRRTPRGRYATGSWFDQLRDVR